MFLDKLDVTNTILIHHHHYFVVTPSLLYMMQDMDIDNRVLGNQDNICCQDTDKQLLHWLKHKFPHSHNYTLAHPVKRQKNDGQ